VVDELSGLGRDELLCALKKAHAERDAVVDAVEPRDRAFVRLYNENVTLNETLTAAQAAGTRAELGRQRARALLREVLGAREYDIWLDLCSRIEEELGL
jgi:hypothetical protein